MAQQTRITLRYTGRREPWPERQTAIAAGAFGWIREKGRASGAGELKPRSAAVASSK